MRVMVTGAGGMLGVDVVDTARAAGHEVDALARGDLDITDAAAIDRAMKQGGPDVVVNCAAWTDVDGAEDNRDAAFAVNADGAGHVAAGAAAVGALAVHLSTDYVFDGTKTEAYVESDPTGPRSVYGESKLAGERAVAEANPRHMIVRTAWVFGPAGRNFVETMLGLAAERDEVKVVADQLGCPTYTGHLAAGLLALAESDLTGVVHLAGGGRCSWHEFATEIFKQAEADCEAVPCTTDEFPRPAPRPAWSVLGSEVPHAPTLPPWQEGLAAYLAER